ncbi:methyltransferase domain-containing protein [Streptomyces sp. BK208]|uniref:methyltransferase domain-containing protein n=1 Tax=Streptomyces sp. BK208 TaxID=2512150 RepID=UPI001AB0104D|nr:methyltransferase domain-containing protein [Streptomyces sp. BK208]
MPFGFPQLSLEILRTRRFLGSGGYNAALTADLAGPTGHVTTLDIDPAVTERAAHFLAETGYDGVRVVTADAEHLPERLIPNGGFDASAVTVIGYMSGFFSPLS